MFSKLKSLFPKPGPKPVDESRTYKTQGDEHLGRGELDEAARCYRRALSSDPDYVAACVGLGFALSEQGNFPEAEQHLRRAVAIDPAVADAHYILGRISTRRGDEAGSIEHFARAIEAKPDFEFAYRDLIAALGRTGQNQRAKDLAQRAVSLFPKAPEFHLYLGDLLGADGDHGGAAACFRTATSLQPGFAQAHRRLADALRACGKLDQAVASYQHALRIDPTLAEAHLEVGKILLSQKKLDPAIVSFRRAAELGPDNAAAHQYLGNALLEHGDAKGAVACFERVVALDPDNPVKHLIAALSGQASERAPAAYVEQLFDQYADGFESHLVGALQYNGPRDLANLLRPHSDREGRKWTVLDLGCGTGLVGVAMAPYADQLVGVDLSAKMLDKARTRNRYARLEQGDLLGMMQGEPASSYNVVVAADVFVYLGKLDELAGEAARLLRPGGYFAFSVESLDALPGGDSGPAGAPGFRLNVTGRYAHSAGYLARLAADNGFEVLNTVETQVRLDKSGPVQGYLVLWRRGAAAAPTCA